MGNQGILRPIFSLLGVMLQYIEPCELQIVVDNGLNLLGMQGRNRPDGAQKILHQPHLFLAEADFRNLSPRLPFWNPTDH